MLSALKVDWQELATLTCKVLDAWRIPLQDQALLLGVSPRTLRRYRQGCSLFALRRGVRERMSGLCLIYEMLHSTDLDRPDRADGWVTRPSAEYGGRGPVDVMINEGVEVVRRRLEDSLMY